MVCLYFILGSLVGLSLMQSSTIVTLTIHLRMSSASHWPLHSPSLISSIGPRLSR